MIKDVTDLHVYQRSMALILPMKRLVSLLPKNEYTMRDQCTKTMYRIPATIAEGWGKKHSEKEFNRFLRWRWVLATRSLLMSGWLTFVSFHVSNQKHVMLSFESIKLFPKNLRI